MARLQAPGMVLILWQGLSMAPTLAEFVYDRPAPLLAILTSAITVLGWLGLAAWAGSRRVYAFPWFASVVWVAVIVVMLLGMLTLTLESDDSVTPWHGPLLMLIIVAGGPLYGLSPLLPTVEPFLRNTIIAALILTLSLVIYFVARRRGLDRHHSAKRDPGSSPG